MGAAIVSLLFTIAAIVFICFLAWFVTRLVATGSGTAGHGKNIRIIEKVAVSKDTCIMLVEFFGKVMVIGSTPQGMTILKEFSENDVDVQMPKPITSGNFSQAFKDALGTVLPDGVVKNTVNKFGGKFKQKGDADEKK